MSNQIFRKVSLDRLSSPEELDQLITVTSPRGWLALLGLGCILFTALIWGFLGNIPTQTTGAGILTTSGGIVNIAHTVSGRITDIGVRPGDYIKKGDIVARIEQSELVDQINTYRKEIQLIQDFDLNKFNEDKASLSSDLSDMYNLARSITQEKATLNIRQDTQMEKSRTDLKQSDIGIGQAVLKLNQYRLEADEAGTRLMKAKALYSAGAISEAELRDAQLKNDNAQSIVKAAELELETARLNRATIEKDMSKLENKVPFNDKKTSEMSEAELQLQQLEAKFEELKFTKLNEINDKLDKAVNLLEENSSVVSEVFGRVLEVNIMKGDIIQAGVPIISVARDAGLTNSLGAIIFVPAEEGKKIRPGMTAHISPTIAKVEDYGYMLGEVASVSEYPVSLKNLVQVLGNQELANKLSGGGAPIEVYVNLVHDASTFSGYKWTTAKGPSMQIDSGNICSGIVVVDNRKPIEMIVPYIKSKLNLN